MTNQPPVGIFVIALVVVLWIAARVVAHSLKRETLMKKYGDKSIVDRIMRKVIWEGMTEAQLIDARGRPSDIDERVFKRKTVLVYKYHPDGRKRFRTRITVENGSVVGWQLR